MLTNIGHMSLPSASTGSRFFLMLHTCQFIELFRHMNGANLSRFWVATKNQKPKTQNPKFKYAVRDRTTSIGGVNVYRPPKLL